MIRFVPLVRGGYAMAIVVGWLTYNKASGLFVSYLTMLLATVYFSSLAFCTRTQGQSLGDRLRRCALVGIYGCDYGRFQYYCCHRDGTCTFGVAGGTGYDDVPDLYGLCHQPDSKKRTKRKRSIINNWRQLMKVSQNNCSGISMPKNTAHLHVADGQYPN